MADSLLRLLLALVLVLGSVGSQQRLLFSLVIAEIKWSYSPGAVCDVTA
jgi:hypothetical protein